MKILYLNVFKSITSRVVLLFYTKWEIFENGKMHSYAPDYKEISVLLMKRLSLIFLKQPRKYYSVPKEDYFYA